MVKTSEISAIHDRAELVLWLRSQLPLIPAEDTNLGTIRGGRAAALVALGAIQPQAYERSRNFLSGDVTRISPYLRHGVLTMAEVRDFSLSAVVNANHAGKLINEIAWRDYWQRLYVQLGEGIWQDREGYKTGFKAAQYSQEMPPAVLDGTTSLVCIDNFSRDLRETGYLHNHARMWMAAYLVHWLRIRWQIGARWFLQHLLDGDPASNNLSWQWVASTFGSKAYFFNRENLQRYTENVYCKQCSHAKTGSCPFDASYDELTDRLFPRLADANGLPEAPRPYQKTSSSISTKPSPRATGKPLIWVHTDNLNQDAAVFKQWPQSPAVFVWDTHWLTTQKISLKRIVFIAECLQQMPGHMEIRFGDPATEVLAAAREHGANSIVTQRTPDTRLIQAASQLERTMPVIWTIQPPFVEDTREFDLKRFSRYWQDAKNSAMRPTQS